MRVGIYSRVSTSDKDQNPETQLLPLREFVQAQGWEPAGEWIDHASATDLKGRTAWRGLLDAASKRKVDAILCWKLDRCFRSVVHMVSTVEQLRRFGVALRSYSEPMIDTTDTSPMGNLLLTILAAVAEFEKGLIRERVKAGMARAKKQGYPIGRPRAAVNGEWGEVLALVERGAMSQADAIQRLRISRSTFYRLKSQKGAQNRVPQSPEK